MPIDSREGNRLNRRKLRERRNDRHEKAKSIWIHPRWHRWTSEIDSVAADFGTIEPEKFDYAKLFKEYVIWVERETGGKLKLCTKRN